jgi:hypothetical protein
MPPSPAGRRTAARKSGKAAPRACRKAAPALTNIDTLRYYWEKSEYTLAEIAHLTGSSQVAISRAAKAEGFGKRTFRGLAKSRRRKACEGEICPGLLACPKRNILSSRLLHVVEREIFRLNGPLSEAAVDVRALSALSTVLGRLFLFDRDNVSEDHARDIDPYAPPIARRIRDAIAEALGGSAEGHATGGDEP